MVQTKQVFLILVLLGVFLTPVLADQEYPDISCADCTTYFGEYGYCSASNTCMISDQPRSTTQAASASQTSSTSSTSSSEQNINELRSITKSLQERVAALESDYVLIQNELSQLAVAQGGVSATQITDLKTELNSISTGLAGLQESTSRTLSQLATVENSLQEKKSFNSILTISLLTLLAIAVALTVTYLITKGQKKHGLNPEIREYITHEVKLGKKYPVIKDALIHAGWTEEDVKYAYTETMKHNYQKYKSSSKPESRKNPLQNKTILVVALSILVLVGAILILRGVTGKAIYFTSLEELNTAVREKLEENVATNQFYPFIQNIDLCVEVNDGPKRVSYTVLKTGSITTINPAFQHCSEDPAHDASLKFNSWQSFDTLVEDSSCENARQLHATVGGVYVLPSRFVLPGFHKNPILDYSPYCPALTLCLSPAELAVMGC